MQTLTPTDSERFQRAVAKMREREAERSKKHAAMRDRIFAIMDHGYTVRDSSGINVYGMEFSAFDAEGNKRASAESTVLLLPLVMAIPKAKLNVDLGPDDLFSAQYAKRP